MTDTMVASLIIVGVLVVLLGVLRLRQVSLQGLVIGLIGAILGLLLGALASVPLSKLPSPLGGILPLAASITFTVVLTGLVLGHRRSLLAMLPFLKLERASKKTEEAPEAPEPTAPVLPQILVDTSVIIDGRIADIATAGFVPGRLVVPRFVLAELQNIADSDDAMRRGRGRRGLDVLNQLREMPDVDIEIIEDDVTGIREVDAKLVALAQKFSCNVLTTDYNLNRVAQIQGVRVLNVNELSNAIRPVVLPGEELVVRVVQQGKERNQGVGYLADGTMIVVENGDKLIGQEVPTEVTRVFQTVAGKMIFAVPRKSETRRGEPMPATEPAPKPHAQPSAETTAPAKPETAKNSTDAPKDNGKDNPGRRNRFNRGHKRPTDNQPQGPNPGRGSGVEDRIIAATNNPDHSGEQSN